MMKRVFALLLAMMMVFGLFAGCANSDQPASSGTTPSQEAQKEVITAAEQAGNEKKDIDTEADYDTLSIGVSNLSHSLNPYKVDSEYGDLIYTCVAKTNVLTGETVGYMGDCYWSDDHMTIYCDIWDNIYDTANNHITADDVIFSWDTAKAEGAHMVNNYERWYKVDDDTVAWDLKKAPNMDGAQLSVYIVSQAAYEASADHFATMPVASGTYSVESYTSDYQLLLTRNDNFWATDEQRAIVKEAYGDQWECNWEHLQWMMISEPTQITVALETGTIDYSAAVAADDIPLFADGGVNADDCNVYNFVSGLNYSICYNTDPVSPCNDVRVRRAISYAIDNQFVVDVVFGGDAIPAHEMGGSFLMDYDEDWLTEDNYYQTSVEKAQELLDEAGYSNGLKLTYMGDTSTYSSNIGVVLQSLLARVGIDLEIVTLDRNLQKEYKTNDHSSWDLYFSQVGSEDFIWNAWDKAYRQGENAWEGTNGYYVDEKLAQLLTNVTSADTYGEESIREFHAYTIDLCLMHALCNACSNTVVRDGIQLVLSPTGKDVYFQAFYWTK